MRARRWPVTPVALSLLLALAAAPPLASSAAAQTVDDIIKRGKVIVGVNTTTPIFGLIGADGQPEGYDPDVARLVGKYLGVQVEFVPVTGANRLPYLLTNRVDMVIALFGITPERALQALISGQIDVVGTGLLVNRTLNRNDPGKNYEVKIVLRPLHFGIGIRRGQTDLLQWLNTFVYTIKNNGELEAISR